MSMRDVERLLEGDDARRAYLAEREHADSAWFYHIVSALRAHVANGGDFVDGVRHILVSVNARLSADNRARIDEAMRTVKPTFIIPRDWP